MHRAWLLVVVRILMVLSMSSNSCEPGYGPGYPECRKSCTANCEGQGQGYLDLTGAKCECSCFEGYEGENCLFCSLGYNDIQPGRASICVGTKCDFPPSPVSHQVSSAMRSCENATKQMPVPHKGICPLVCDPGYVASGSFQCNLGTYSLERCLPRNCNAPAAPDYGSIFCANVDGLASVELNSVCKLQCQAGYEGVGQTTTTCAVTGDASPEAIPSYQDLGKCQPHSCGDISQTLGVAKVSYSSRTVGAVADVVCDTGYEPVVAGPNADTARLSCAPLSEVLESTVSWRGEPACRPRNCTTFGLEDPHGQFQIQGLSNGSTSTLVCHPGYELRNNDGVYTCNGTVFTGDDDCSAPAKCTTSPSLPEHASHALCTGSSTMYSEHGTSCSLRCESGYSTTGQYQCTHGSWTSWPVCFPEGGQADALQYIAGKGTIYIGYTSKIRDATFVDTLWPPIGSAMALSMKRAFPEVEVVDVTLTSRNALVVGMGPVELNIEFRIQIEVKKGDVDPLSNLTTMRDRFATMLADEVRGAPGWQPAILRVSIWFLTTALGFTVKPPPPWCEKYHVEFLDAVFDEDQCREEGMLVLTCIILILLLILLLLSPKFLHRKWEERKSLVRCISEAEAAKEEIRQRESVKLGAKRESIRKTLAHAGRRSREKIGKGIELVRKLSRKLTRKLTSTMKRLSGKSEGQGDRFDNFDSIPTVPGSVPER